MSIEYIAKSSKPLPEWIKNHVLFSKELTKIDKIFPQIGLPNFREPCDIMNTAEATTEAQKLGNKLTVQLNAYVNDLYTKLDAASPVKGNGKLCAELQSTINIINSLVRSLRCNDYYKVVEGKLVLKLRADIYEGGDKPFFHKDEAIIRIYGKLCEQLEKFGIKTAPIDQWVEFKSFSKVNIPNKKYNVVFSSYGEEGAWDIATISMRGITSCQAWNTPQCRGLIGSISSKFVGVIYLESEHEIPLYGSKMLNRSMVRFAINNRTHKPALIMDTVYPNQSREVVNTFKKILADKSGLDVYCSNDPSGNSPDLASFYIPDEPARKHLKPEENSYMDYKMPIQKHTSLLKRPVKDLNKLTLEFKKIVCNDIDKMVATRRELYIAASKQLDAYKAEYDAAKEKWEAENKDKPEAERSKFNMEKPHMDKELAAFGKGGVLNLLTHCDKRYGNNSAGKTFASIILDSVEVPEKEMFSSNEEYHRRYIMTFLTNTKSIREKAWKKAQEGSWMKSFPKCAERFFAMIFSQMKHYMIASCKDLIRKAN